MTSLTQVAQEGIKQDILECKLRPNDVVTAAELAAEYRCSVTPIRDALRGLEQEGFLEIIPRVGYRILPITLKDLEELFTLRRRLEELAAELAVQNGSEQELWHLQELTDFEPCISDPKSFEKFKTLNRAFHLGVVQASKNRRLTRAFRPLLQELDRLHNLGIDLSGSMAWMQKDHQRLVEALLKRNEALAVQLAGQHVEATKREIFRIVASVGGSGIQLNAVTTD